MSPRLCHHLGACKVPAVMVGSVYTTINNTKNISWLVSRSTFCFFHYPQNLSSISKCINVGLHLCTAAGRKSSWCDARWLNPHGAFLSFMHPDWLTDVMALKMSLCGLYWPLSRGTVTRRWVTPKIWKPLYLAESDGYTSDTSLKNQILALNGVLICQGRLLWMWSVLEQKIAKQNEEEWFYKLADILI